MKNDTFADLVASANEALEHARGKRRLHTTPLALPMRTLKHPATKRVRRARDSEKGPYLDAQRQRH